ncbi:MAG: hypothetical protein WCB11_10960, partial [Terriglobales bacterium]
MQKPPSQKVPGWQVAETVQAEPFQNCPGAHWLAAITDPHIPLPLRNSPGGQTAQGPVQHGTGGLVSAFSCGFRFLKWCQNPFFSGAALSLVSANLLAVNGSLFPIAAVVFNSRTASSSFHFESAASTLVCDAAAPALATCAAGLPELWLPVELADAWELPVELLWEGLELDEPLDLTEPPELLRWLLEELVEWPELEPPDPDECCAGRAAEANRIVATTRQESRKSTSEPTGASQINLG